MKHLLSLLFVIVFTACSKSHLPTLYDVQITITQEGKPLAEAIVSLQSAEGSPFVVSGATNGSGVAVMYSNGKYRGAPAGEYKVCVEKATLESSPPEPVAHTPEHEAWEQELAKNPPGAWRYVEEQYGSAETTPLPVVSVTGKTKKEFDVGKAVKVKLASD